MYNAYRHVAARLGLRLSPPDPGAMTSVVELNGELDGHPVVLRRYCGYGAFIRAIAPLVPTLDLGLGLAPAGMLSTISEWFGSKDIQVGDSAFDQCFSIRGDEPDRVRALLTPEVRAELGAASFPGRLTDAEVCLELSTDVESVAGLEHALRSVVHTAATVGRTRLGLPPATLLRDHHERWVSVASKRDWHIEERGRAFAKDPWREANVWHRRNSARSGASRSIAESRVSENRLRQ